MLLAQYIFAHSIGFEICKITVVRIANAYIHGVRIANHDTESPIKYLNFH